MNPSQQSFAAEIVRQRTHQRLYAINRLATQIRNPLYNSIACSMNSSPLARIVISPTDKVIDSKDL